MIPNLQIELRRFISSNVISKLNKFYYENDALLIKGIDVSIGTVLMGCYSYTDEKSFKKMIKSLEKTLFFKEIDFVAERILTVDDCYKTEGNSYLELLFANKKARITEMISNEVGIKSETAREILNFSVLLTLSYLRNNSEITANLKSLLDEQKREILNSIPPGIKIILGFSGYESSSIEEKTHPRLGKSLFTFFGKQL